MLYAIFFVLFFFFKQKPAYEMRISDGSSDVCSSDLFSALFSGYMRPPIFRAPASVWRPCNASFTATEEESVAKASPIRAPHFISRYLLKEWSDYHGRKSHITNRR